MRSDERTGPQGCGVPAGDLWNAGFAKRNIARGDSADLLGKKPMLSFKGALAWIAEVAPNLASVYRGRSLRFRAQSGHGLGEIGAAYKVNDLSAGKIAKRHSAHFGLCLGRCEIRAFQSL